MPKRAGNRVGIFSENIFLCIWFLWEIRIKNRADLDLLTLDELEIIEKDDN